VAPELLSVPLVLKMATSECDVKLSPAKTTLYPPLIEWPAVSGCKAMA